MWWNLNEEHNAPTKETEPAKHLKNNFSFLYNIINEVVW